MTEQNSSINIHNKYHVCIILKINLLYLFALSKQHIFARYYAPNCIYISDSGS